MPLEAKTTQLELDGRWGLEELSDTTKDYIQLYGFAYSLIPDLPTARREEIDYIYGKFPWRGGYSTVNFFNQLFHKIPPKFRPEVQRIQYASPGFIELTELLAVAVTIAGIVTAVCKSLGTVHDLYRNIQKASVDHELSKINLAKEDLELKQRQITFCENASKRLVDAFGLTDAQEKLIDQKVQHNPVMKLKILLSVFRRVEPLAKRQAEGKLKITGKEHHPK
ncbi:MAG: GNAT family N-acetyltransferase [Deltaproteobacteria bacterium]|nr:GNAT family N-acetyltransferase [Deltaproteobacteria bacterium]